jgi:hypothetical protein
MDIPFTCIQDLKVIEFKLLPVEVTQPVVIFKDTNSSSGKAFFLEVVLINLKIQTKFIRVKTRINTLNSVINVFLTAYIISLPI